MAIHYKAAQYGVVFTSQCLSESRNGHPQVVLSFKPTHLERVNTDGSIEWESLTVEPYERTIYLIIMETTVDFVCRKLSSIGLQVKEWGQINLSHPSGISIVGKKGVVRCSHEVYKDKDVERWDIPLDTGERKEIKPLDDMQIRALDAVFSANLAEANRASPIESQPQAVQQGAQVPTQQSATHEPKQSAQPSDDFPF